MITEINVRAVLSRSGGEFHGDLVTRPTGRAVRTSIEQELGQHPDARVVVLDFSSVRLIDWSCADEIVAKLLQTFRTPASADAGRCFLIRGLSETHVDLLEEVLQRHQLALVAEDQSGALRLLGRVAERARQAFDRLVGRGSAAAEELAADLAWSLDETRAALEDLAGRRLVMRSAERYLALSSA